MICLLFSLIAINFGTLNGQESPKIVPFSSLVKPVIGGKTSFTCQSLSGSPPLQITWFKDGKQLAQDLLPSIKLRTNEEVSTLIIDSIKSSHSGNYTCQISNRYGADLYSTELIIEGPPNWIKKPNDMKKQFGDTITIDCIASGYPKPKVNWKRMKETWNQINDYYSNMETIGSNNEKLILRNVTRDNGGRYGCSISNGIQPDLWTEFQVTIDGFPAKLKNKNTASSSVSVKKGNKLEIDCEVEGDKPINMNWIKNSITQNKFDNPRLDINELPTVDGIKSILTIKSADSVDDGVYQCQAENKYGKDEKTIKVTIVEPPPSPQSFMVHQAWSRSVNVGWSKLSSSSSKTPILGYVIRYWKTSSPGINEQLHEVNVSASMNSYLIKDIEPGTMFEATLMAVNEVGLGSPSRVISFTTGEEEPSSAPVDLVATPRGPSTIRITWRPPPRDSHNGKLLGYYVGYRRADDYKSTHFFKTVDSLGPNVTHEYLLTSLTKATDYSITVKAFNSAGSGPAYQEITVATLAGDVAPSPRLHITQTTVDSITLKYTLPQGALGSIDHLDLHFKEDDEPHWRSIDFFFDGKETAEYTLSGLNPSMVYKFYLTASNSHGASDPSSIVTAKTSRPARDAFTFGSVFDPASDAFGSYWNMITVLSITIAVAIIIIVIVIAFVFVRKAQLEAATKPAYEFSLASQAGTLGYNQSIPPTGTVRRFVDIDVNTNKPLMHGSLVDEYPTPYSKLTVDGNNKHSVLVDHNHVYDCPR
ncbi:receptor-type tyrosine-protein phosphatase F-like isoform X2 [Panonychus citri]|uniref:receptor-type tyrosine-protein phosphatase F-like isoform X2 n=1 Tax=Panonychus citri TaxID=50023 RepID=UPI0023072226|nr:receptor-type tyrosine-protein phosphatase F-like isoform X2 [Panonychus citri]